MCRVVSCKAHWSYYSDHSQTPLQAFFHEKDYLNHRYHVKRALFLAGVAKALEANCSAFESFELVPFKADVRKPILVLTPGEAPIHIYNRSCQLAGFVEAGDRCVRWHGQKQLVTP